MPPIYKVCLVGPESVGKTSLVRRFTRDSFELEYIRTLGVAVSKKQIPVDSSRGGGQVTLMVWDIIGDYDFFSLVADAYLQGANGIMAVIDLTRQETVAGLRRWGEAVRTRLPSVEGVIAANKADLQAKRKVTAEEVEDEARRLRWSSVETSALSGAGVEEAFGMLRDSLLRRRTLPGP